MGSNRSKLRIGSYRSKNDKKIFPNVDDPPEFLYKPLIIPNYGKRT